MPLLQPAPFTLSQRAAGLSSSRIRDLLRLVDRPGILSMAGGLPAPASLDADRVGRAVANALTRTGVLGPPALQYGPTEGVAELREIVARRVGEGVTADEVLVTTGSQQAIDLLARALCDPGDEVVVEAPSYLGALQAFAAAGARLLPIEGDRAGLDVDRLDAALHDGRRPRLVYVVPDFHNPTGAVLPADRRRHLAALADRYGFVIVEDDPYGELRFAGTTPPPIARFGDRVVRLGTASKILAPGLRVGWMTGPREILDAAVRLKQAVDLHTPTLNQLAVAAMLADEDGQRDHITRIRGLYAERAAALGDSLTRHLGDRVRFEAPAGGMFIWAVATDGTDTEALLPRALDHGVAFVPGAAFAPSPGRFTDAMRLSYATLDAPALDEAVTRLAAAW